MGTFTLTTCLAVAFTQTPVGQKPKELPPQPKLLAKSATSFLHAVPTKGRAVVHTTIATGEMKLLASGDYSSLVLPSSTGGSTRPVVVVHDARIAGVAVDKERIYVLHWDGSATDGYFASTTYTLFAFAAQDGKLISKSELKGEHVPKELPKATTESGPLRLHESGVSCFGTRFEFKGATLIKQSAEKQP
jgi:hypothetical protein